MGKKLLIIFLSITGGLLALSVTFMTIFLVREKKKKDEEELEHYLDSSIL